MGVNKDLIQRENMKRGLGKGSWKSSKELREVTIIMERTIWFFKNVKLQPISNLKGHTTTLYEHFIVEDEKTRLERDTKSIEISEGGAYKVMSFRFMPQLLQTEDNMDMVNEYYRLATQFKDLSERATKPCRCCFTRTSCSCCFTSLFGEVKQMG